VNIKQEVHSKFTFQDALSDYAEHSGYTLPQSMRKDLTSRFYKPSLELEPLSALQYGKNIWLLGFEEDLKWLEGIFSLNMKTGRIARLL